VNHRTQTGSTLKRGQLPLNIGLVPKYCRIRAAFAAGTLPLPTMFRRLSIQLLTKFLTAILALFSLVPSQATGYAIRHIPVPGMVAAGRASDVKKLGDGGGSLTSSEGVAPSWIVGVSTSVIFPCTIKCRRQEGLVNWWRRWQTVTWMWDVFKERDTGSPGQSRTKGRKTVVVVVVVVVVVSSVTKRSRVTCQLASQNTGLIRLIYVTTKV